MSENYKQADMIYHSALSEKTKEFLLFVIAQLRTFDMRNDEKMLSSKKTGAVEKIKEWHDNGSIFYEMTIRNGVREGSFTMWDTKGRKVCSIPFEGGKMHGILSLFKSDGEERIRFENDTPILLDK
jgi:antitoxin component YwqK of YwqJK toxin-antitoxin module